MATIREVAKLAGVSTATVSHVLHGRSERMSPATRERVLAAIRELRYRPTAFETNQRAALTNNLAVVVPEIGPSPILNETYFSPILDGLLESAALRGFSITILIERVWTDSGAFIRRMYDGKCDGIVMVAPNRDSESIQHFVERGLPLVLVGTSRSSVGISSVDIDNASAAYEATRHLLDLGHRKIAYLSGNYRQLSAEERGHGYERALREAGIPESDICIVSSSHLSESEAARIRNREDETVFWGPEMLDIAFEQLGNPTAFLCWNDGLGADVVEDLRRRGLSVPNDVSVITFDDTPKSRACDPPLTAVRQPLGAIGRRAATMVLDKVANPGHPDEHVRFAADLVLRESTAPAPSGDRKTSGLN